MGLPVGFQLRLALTVGSGLPQAGRAVGAGGLQGGSFLGQGGIHQGEGQLHRRFAFRRGKAFRQQGLGVPAQAAAGFVCSGKGALGGGAGRLRGTVGFLGGLPGLLHLYLRGCGAGQNGPGRVMGTAAHRAGGTLGQLLCQQTGLRVQKGPVQCIPPGAGFILPGSGGAVGVLCPAGLPGLFLAVGQPLGKGVQRGAAGFQLRSLILQSQLPGGGIHQHGKDGVGCSKAGVQRFQLGAALRGQCPGQLRGILCLLLLPAQRVQLVVGGQGGAGLGHLSGQGIQPGGILGVAGALSFGGIQCGPGGVQRGLLFGQLPGQLRGLPGGSQLLLYGIQPGFGVGKGCGGGLLCGLLALQQPLQ